ncbi:PAS domain-containing sensor histidine kinase [Methanolobus sp. ZRKC2]|uniref:PAS domain-containing sensor histidine kinase n=1 Tax=Methanolobus sp. ZRKC2 TaxID=3125783 RepID=UPI0032563DFF
MKKEKFQYTRNEDSSVFSEDDMYKSFFKENNAVILLVDPDTSYIVDANLAACKYYGWTFEEISSKKIDEINSLSAKEIEAEIERAAVEQRNYFFFKHRLANGTIRYVEVYCGPMKLDSRRLLYFIVHDITERKLAEEELRSKEMQLRTAQKVSSVGSWEINLSTGKVDASDEARRIYGLEGEKLTIERIQKVPLPEYRSIMDKLLSDLIEKNRPYEIQFKIKRQTDGIVLDIHSVAEYYAERNVIIGTIQDVSERMQAERELLSAKIAAEAASRSKDEFLATMSHELRTPLNSIIGFSDILLDETFGNLNEKQASYIIHISKGGKHLLNLINNILDLSKVEAGKMELDYEQFHVSSSIDEIKTVIYPLAIKKNIRLNVKVDSHLDKIDADKTKFKQILYNLTSNAIKFTPKKGNVTIEARKSGEFAQVSITDTGIGISKSDMKKLFQPFKQLNPYLTREYEGTGLGLALVKKFVEMHNGNIWVESEVGEGSIFTFTLPLNCVIGDKP